MSAHVSKVISHTVFTHLFNTSRVLYNVIILEMENFDKLLFQVNKIASQEIFDKPLKVKTGILSCTNMHNHMYVRMCANTQHTYSVHRNLVWHFVYCYQRLIIMWKWLWLVIRNYATAIQIRYICDWIWDYPSSTHTTTSYYTFHHYTIAVHTS